MAVTVIGNTVYGTEGQDQITLRAVNYGIAAVNIQGHGGNDLLTGDGRNNIIRGGDGVDKIYAGNGMDYLYGDAGNDIFQLKGEWSTPSYNQPNGLTHFYTGAGPSGTDFYDGGSGLDRLEAGENNLTLVIGHLSELAGDSIEGISSGGFNGFRAFFQGSGLQDFTRVLLDNVTIAFSYADNLIIGSSANQQFDSDNDGDIDSADAYNGATGNDSIDGGWGVDTVLYNADFDAAAKNGAGNYEFTFFAGGQIRVRDLDTSDGDTGTDILTSVERLQFNNVTFDFTPTNWQDTDTAAGTIVNGIAGTIAEDATRGTAVGIDVSVDPSSLLVGAPVIYELQDSRGGMFASLSIP